MGNTRADDKQLGFEYQFYYFILRVLQMKSGDTVGFEAKDDVYIEDESGILSLIQLKYTRQLNVSGQPINLTSSSLDLWKTLSNWKDIIDKETNQQDFINNTKFVFVTNKTKDMKHKFLSFLEILKENNNVEEFKNRLFRYGNELGEKNDNKVYISNLLTLESELLKLFVLRIEFIFNLDNIRRKVKEEIQFGRSISENRATKIFHELVGYYKDKFFDTVKNKGDFKLTRENFYKDTLAIFRNARSDRLPFTIEIEKKNNESILNSTFAKQMLDIGFEKEKVFQADYCRVAMETNINKFLQESEISENDIDLLNRNSVTHWEEEFDEMYLEDSDRNDKTAKKLYLKVLKKDLDLAGQKIEWKEATKGQFIKMSDIPEIGWKYNWKEEYIDES